MKQLQELRKKKAQVYQSLIACCENLKEQLNLLYLSLDDEETLLMENLNIDED